jgi:hypothetical protein
MPMPAKKTAMIVKPIFAPFCGGGLLNSPQLLVQKFPVTSGHFRISSCQEMTDCR